MKKILLHVCCGPCSIYPLDYLRAEGYDVMGYFYNPNIHPYTEFNKRKETLAAYAQKTDWPVIFDEEYQLEEFLREVVHREALRCRYCYVIRLRQAAKIARKGNFDCFTTTLLVSPFQKHELIKETGEAVAQEYGIPFYYIDFRPGFKGAAARSRELEMYRQQYCGCIYSEKERYYRKKKTAKQEG